MLQLYDFFDCILIVGLCRKYFCNENAEIWEILANFAFSKGLLMKKTIILVLWALISSTAVFAQETILGIDGEESTSVGILIKEIESGRVLVEKNSQMALTPASVMKTITSASVLSLEGGSRQFETQVVLRGSSAGGGVWCGDVVVKGVGDPTLESENFKSNRGFCDSIIAALRQKGITKVDGTVVVEQSLRDAGPIVQWEVEDLAWPYGAGLYGFNWRDNTVTVYPNSGRIVPAAPGLTLDVRPSRSGNDFIRGIHSDKLVVYRRNTREDWGVKTTVPDPSAVFGAELARKFERAGIAVGSVAKCVANDPETSLYTHKSPEFSEILRSLMVRSDNLFAEGMLRSLAPGASRKVAIEREKDLWATRGISPRYTIINDGSGLTRANRLSTRFIADVLEYMAKSDAAETYTGFFPVAGKEGTMRGMLAKSPLKGKIALKTGSVSSVQCYAGYKFNDDGKPTHIVVIMINGFFCPRAQVKKACEKLLEKTFL